MFCIEDREGMEEGKEEFVRVIGLYGYFSLSISIHPCQLLPCTIYITNKHFLKKKAEVWGSNEHHKTSHPVQSIP